jgi:hypothetical protein
MVELLAAVDHGSRQVCRFFRVHSAMHNSHEQCGSLILRPGPRCNTLDKRLDFGAIQSVAVAFLAENVDGAHQNLRRFLRYK